MSKINIDADHIPENSIFWASFATEVGERRKYCPTVALYEDQEGKFFVIEHPVNVAPTGYDPIDDPQAWLEERFKLLVGYIESKQ